MYEILPQPIPQARRAEINEKILADIESGENRIPRQTIYNCYTGVGGLHNLDPDQFANYHEYACAKREFEQGQFFTPHALCRQIVSLAASLSERPTIKKETVAENREATESTTPKEQEKPQEIPILAKGSVITLPYANNNVEIAFKNIELNRISNSGFNLVFTVRIKNNSNKKFFISNAKWKLLDSDKVEVEESGIYEPMFDDFAPGMFFFTVVEPNIGKEEEVGYSVREETYYLSINGHIVAKIPLDVR